MKIELLLAAIATLPKSQRPVVLIHPDDFKALETRAVAGTVQRVAFDSIEFRVSPLAVKGELRQIKRSVIEPPEFVWPEPRIPR